MRATAAIAINYNNLLELDEADSVLSAIERQIIIKDLLSIIKEENMEKYVGIRLLHRHNKVSEDEIMAEFYCNNTNGFSLITKATKENDLKGDYVPNSWQLKDNKFVPIEFSETALVADSEVNPDKKSNLFLRLGETLRRTGSASVLGPSLLGSDLIESYRPEGHTVLAESTAQDDRANVLRFARPEPIASSTDVQTHWCVSPNSLDGIVTMTCTRICPSVQNPPVHQGTYIHNQN